MLDHHPGITGNCQVAMLKTDLAMLKTDLAMLKADAGNRRWNLMKVTRRWNCFDVAPLRLNITHKLGVFRQMLPCMFCHRLGLGARAFLRLGLDAHLPVVLYNALMQPVAVQYHVRFRTHKCGLDVCSACALAICSDYALDLLVHTAVSVLQQCSFLFAVVPVAVSM